MQLSAYWMANFLVDFVKLELNVGVSLLTFIWAGQDWNSIWFSYCLMPFGALPFTYVSTFLFNGESSAQTFTIFLHWSSVGMWASLVFFLRFMKNTEMIGDVVNWIFRITVPTYSLGSAIYINSLQVNLADYRSGTNGTGWDLNPYEWTLENTFADGVI